MRNVRVSKRYAVALYNTALQMNVLEQVHSDLEVVASHMEQSKDLKAVMNSPVIQSWRKKDVLKEIFQSKISELSMSYLVLLCDKNRENLTEDILNQFELLYNDSKGLIPVTVTSAVQLSEEERAKVVSKVVNEFGKTPVPTYLVDTTIKGGIVLKIGDYLYDMSVKSQLAKLYDSLANGVSNN